MIDSRLEKLSKENTEEYVYGCNPNNKGKLVAFLFIDGFYVYEIGEDGSKVKDEVVYFKKEKY